jgi:putative FmdB family regulatory protein
MPTYELRCLDCGREFELFRTRLLRDDEKVCPGCGSVNVKLGVGGGYLSKSSASEPTGACPKAATCPSATSSFG